MRVSPLCLHAGITWSEDTQKPTQLKLLNAKHLGGGISPQRSLLHSLPLGWWKHAACRPTFIFINIGIIYSVRTHTHTCDYTWAYIREHERHSIVLQVTSLQSCYLQNQIEVVETLSSKSLFQWKEFFPQKCLWFISILTTLIDIFKCQKKTSRPK